MKNILILTLLVTSFATAIKAQAPEKFSYQAVIRNADNDLLVNTTIGMQISILKDAINGNPVYVETQTASTNENGLVSVEIGAGTLVSGNFSTINWAEGTYFIKTETDITGGNNYTISGTSQLLSVPYALHATTAKTAENGFTHYVGEVFGGGVVFHVYRGADGLEHGLIVSLSDIATEVSWSNLFLFEIGISAQSSWEGLANSEAIVNQNGHNESAAQLCLNYESPDGFDDWYLPSIDELLLLYHRRFDINRALSIAGQPIQMFDPNQDFNYLHYWSSTEIDDQQAWRFSFTPGANDFSHFASKSSMNHVRAIRAF